MGTDEDPRNKYDQEFFLDLAAKGKDAWNTWRRDPANEGVRVTFADIDFSEAPRDEIDFSGFEFGDFAYFTRCKWRGGEVLMRMLDPEAFLPGGACFSGATFGKYATFTDARFGRLASFAGTAFGDSATFEHGDLGDYASFAGATFGSFAIFAGAAFGSAAIFAGAAFEGAVSFADAAFDDRASFAGAAFGNGAHFTGAAFGKEASFVGAAFGHEANFSGAAFGHGADFAGCFFKGRVLFTGKSIEQWSGDLKASQFWIGENDRNAREKLHEGSWRRNGSGPDRFIIISFERARFAGEAIFSGRSFEQIADFTNVRFYYPPDFDTAANVARIDFTGAQVSFVPPHERPWTKHWTKDSRVPVRLRALRKIAEETKSHDLERDLYIQERKAERGVYWRQLIEELKKAPEELKKKLEDINKQKKHVWLEWRLQRRARHAQRLGIAVKVARLAVHGFWIVVMGVYWALSDYGRSFIRPAVWLVSSGFFFYLCYRKILAPLMPKAGPLADKYEHAVGMVALGNAVPFVGPLTIDGEVKKFLFCAGDANCLPIPPEGFQLLVVGQNVLSIILVFFIGLALRNYFRIK